MVVRDGPSIGRIKNQTFVALFDGIYVLPSVVRQVKKPVSDGKIYKTDAVFLSSLLHAAMHFG